MAKIPGKGTVLQVEIASVLTAVAQITEIDIGEQDPEVFESRTLDGGAGVGRDPTGYTSQGDSQFGIFYDPAQATHQFIAAQSQTPGTKVAGKVILVDTGSTEIAFTAAAIALGRTSVRMNDGVKTQCTIKHDGLCSYPTS